MVLEGWDSLLFFFFVWWATIKFWISWGHLKEEWSVEQGKRCLLHSTFCYSSTAPCFHLLLQRPNLQTRDMIDSMEEEQLVGPKSPFSLWENHSYCCCCYYSQDHHPKRAAPNHYCLLHSTKIEVRKTQFKNRAYIIC